MVGKSVTVIRLARACNVRRWFTAVAMAGADVFDPFKD